MAPAVDADADAGLFGGDCRSIIVGRSASDVRPADVGCIREAAVAASGALGGHESDPRKLHCRGRRLRRQREQGLCVGAGGRGRGTCKFIGRDWKVELRSLGGFTVKSIRPTEPSPRLRDPALTRPTGRTLPSLRQPCKFRVDSPQYSLRSAGRTFWRAGYLLRLRHDGGHSLLNTHPVIDLVNRPPSVYSNRARSDDSRTGHAASASKRLQVPLPPVTTIKYRSVAVCLSVHRPPTVHRPTFGREPASRGA